MINKRLSGLMAASACIALISAMPVARAQMAPTPLAPMDQPLATAAPTPLTPSDQPPTQWGPAPMTPGARGTMNSAPVNPPQTASMPPVEVITNSPQVSPGD